MKSKATTLNRKTGPHVRVGRAAVVSARRSLLDRVEASSLAYALSRKASSVRYSYPARTLGQVEDHRLWTPERYFPTLRSISGAPARTVVASTPARRGSVRSSRFLTPTITFHAPQSVAVCVRRHRRRESLFALQRVGSGVSIKTRPRRNWSSSISCRG